MMRIICLLFLIQVFNTINLVAQRSVDTLSYRSKENPYYWKNRKPFEGYWQQDVKLEMDVRLDDIKDCIESSLYRLTYFNNSPHTLNELYFHINEQAFQPGSYYDNLNRSNGIKPKFGKYESKGLGTVVSNIAVNGKKVEPIVDNTVFKINLPEPLKSGDSLLLTLDFKTFFDAGGNMRRRMKMYNTFGFKHFDAVHWYPQVAVYDAKSGWNVDQHLDKEFYNNFGSFRVRITLPAEYVMEATGILLNQKEVMPDSLRKRLDLSNFEKKPFGEKPSIITERLLDENGDPLTKTWEYFATNVHNFAFTADPLYRIDEKEWNGIKAIALVQEPHASRWQPSARFASKVIEVYSKSFGQYVWPKIVVADARDGMEYPMITLDNGTYPGHQQLLAHEIGHMWFYGMVGNNETYRAFLDEGFTQFLTVWAMDSIVGVKRQRTHPNKWIRKHLDSEHTLNERLYYPYLRTVHDGWDEPLNTHSSHFNGAIRHGGSYGLVYYKTGVMLHNLRYVLGDSLFLKCMQHYFDKWKFCHPYPEDFRNAVTEVVQNDMNWFFDQWLETTKTIDYGIVKLKSKRKGDSIFVNTIKIKRFGRMQMPLDISLTLADGKRSNYYIPNTWFEKELESSTEKLPKWYGWDLLNPTYTFTTFTSTKVTKAEIDPSLILADVDRTDNTIYRTIPYRKTILKFDHRVPNYERWDSPIAFWRPDVWYNGVDGLQLGVSMNGNYFKDVFEYKFLVWANTSTLNRTDQFNYFKSDIGLQPTQYDWRNHFSYDWQARKKIRTIGKPFFLELASFMNVGAMWNRVGVEKKFQKQDGRNPNFYIFSYHISSIYRFDNRYPLYPTYHSYQEYHHFNEWSLQRFYSHHTWGRGQLKTNVRTPFWGSDFNYSFLEFEEKHYFKLDKIDFSLRLFGRYGISQSRMPMESALYLSGGNPEQMLDNKYYRSMGLAHYHASYQGGMYQFQGGLNVRGFDNNQAGIQNVGLSGLAANIEIEWDRLFKWKPRKLTSPFHLDVYSFADVGVLAVQTVSNEINKFNQPVASTGIGSICHIKFSPLLIKPILLRFDVPLLTSHTPDGSLWQPRLIFGIGKLL